MNELTYILEKKTNWDQTEEFRWMRSDGQLLSPIFSSMACAFYYRDHMPMITNKEWDQYAISDSSFSGKVIIAEPLQTTA